MGDSNKMGFYEWIDQLNEANEGMTQFGQWFPNTSYSQLKKEDLKRLIYRNMFYRLMNIAAKLFKWTTPDTVNPRILEFGYLRRGAISVFDHSGKPYGLPCIPNNLYNIYGDPTSVNVFGYNGYIQTVKVFYKTDIPIMNKIMELASGQSAEKTPLKGVYSRDNDYAYPYINYIKEYALKLTDKIVALNIATQRLKSPFQYVVDEKEMVESLKKMTEKIENNDDMIFRIRPRKVGNEPKINPVEIVANQMDPNIVKAIKEAILFDFNMFLETLGINTNPSPDKTQVVLTSELNSNNSLIYLEQDVRFLNRKKLCEDVKAVLGFEMSVEKNIEEVSVEAFNFKKEVDNYGSENGTENSRQSVQK